MSGTGTARAGCPRASSDCSDVVHALLQRRDRCDSVGEARTSLVETDQAAERCQPVQKMGWPRMGPHQLHMGDESRDEYQIE